MTPLKHRVYRGLSKACRALGPGGSEGLRVLMYHSVGTPLSDDRYGTGIDRGLFARHVERLAAWKTAPFAAPQDGARLLAVTFDDGYKDTLTTAAPLLVERSIPFTLFAAPSLVRSGSPLYLTPAELKELARLPGAQVGAHGASHRPLTELGDAELAEELTSARKWLEDLLGRPVTALSYPFGRVDRRVRDAARAAGYELCGTSRYGVNGPERDPLLLCRTEVTAWDTVEDLELKVLGHWDWFRHRHPDPALSR